MPRYIALLRGINVGGGNMMKMDDLKAVFSGLGFENVVSYINSGNLAFDTAGAAGSHVTRGSTLEADLVALIEAAIDKKFGRHVDVMVRLQSDIAGILSNNPFEGQYESHKHMHVLFLKEPLPKEKDDLLQASALPGERYEVRGLEIYNLLPNGVAGSLVTKGFFEKKPRVSFTGRNWRTVERLASL